MKFSVLWLWFIASIVTFTGAICQTVMKTMVSFQLNSFNSYFIPNLRHGKRGDYIVITIKNSRLPWKWNHTKIWRRKSFWRHSFAKKVTLSPLTGFTNGIILFSVCQLQQQQPFPHQIIIEIPERRNKWMCVCAQLAGNVWENFWWYCVNERVWHHRTHFTTAPAFSRRNTSQQYWAF